MLAIVSHYGKTFHHEFMAEALTSEPFVVVTPTKVACDCGFEELDPDSVHLPGCKSLWTTIRLMSGREQVVNWNDVKVMPDHYNGGFPKGVSS